MRRNPRAKWVLPDEVNPDGRKLVTLCIPDDPQHIAAFRGALWALASAYNWQDDIAHTAKEVAQVWREVIEDEGSCMEFRQDDCHLYININGIETLIYNGQECIDENIRNGKLAVANSGYQGIPASGACHTYQLLLKPGQTYVLPNVVNTGDTITLSNWRGGATDWGSASVFWICPSGTAYALGACSDVARVNTTYGTDPLQTAPHLAVIAQIGSTYYDVWSSSSGITPGTFTVPAGIVNQPLRLLMNIGLGVALTATGEMWGEVTVCAVPSWCKQWDFSTGSNQGWTARYNTVLNSNGYSDTNGSPPDSVYIDIGGLPSYTANYLELEFLSAWGGSAPRIYWQNVQDPPSYAGNSTASGTTVISIPISLSGNALAIAADRNDGGQEYWGSQRLQKVRLLGTGTNPFGSSNC